MFLTFDQASITRTLQDQKEDTFRASGNLNGEQTRAFMLLSSNSCGYTSDITSPYV